MQDIFEMEQSDIQAGLEILANILTVDSEANLFAADVIKYLDQRLLAHHPFVADTSVVIIGPFGEPKAAGAFLYIDIPTRVEDLILYRYEGLVYPSYQIRVPGIDYDTIQHYLVGPFLEETDDPVETMAMSMIYRVFAMLSSIMNVPIRDEFISNEQHIAARMVRANG